MICLTKLFQQKRRRIGYILAFSDPTISKRDSSDADIEKIASIEGIEYFVNNPFYESFYVYIDVQASTEETKQFECHRLSPRQNVKGLVVKKTNFIGGLDLSDATALSSLGISNNPSVTSLDLTNTAFLNQEIKDFDATMSNLLDCRDCKNLEEIKINLNHCCPV